MAKNKDKKRKQQEEEGNSAFANEDNKIENKMKKKKPKLPHKEKAEQVKVREKHDNKNKKKKTEGIDQEEEGKKKKKNSLITDSRFASAHSDPRFQRVPRHESKIPIDSRFARMLSDKSFASSSAPVDKRGKPRNEKAVNPLLHYYLHQEEELDSRNDGNAELPSEGSSSESELEVSVEEGFDTNGGDESSSTDDYDDEDDEISVNSDICRYLMASHEDTPLIDSETHRLAVVNMDWDHIKAVDLYVVMSSCLPKGGQISSVSIYPSEFGLKCMEDEAVRGPPGLFNDNEEHSEDEAEIDDEKLRTYELNKLRYYYAVVVCDSSATANHIYKTLDGTELLKTSNVFDLRFIPDSMEFRHPHRDTATEAPASYKEPDFHTRALQHSKVKLTWEEDEPHRTKILRRKFNPNQLDELNEYLASSGESDGGENDGEAGNCMASEKLRALLQSEDGSDRDQDDDKHMEITFNTGLEDLSKRILEKKDKKSETVWESELRKRKEKKKARKRRSNHSSEDDSSDFGPQEGPDKPDDFFIEEPLASDSNKNNKGLATTRGGKSNQRGREESAAIHEKEASKAELELLFAEDQEGEDHGAKGYNLKPKKVKGKKVKDVSVEDKLPNVDLSDDPRFSAFFTSHLFALDPTDPQFKRSAAYARQQSGKQRMGGGEEASQREAIDGLKQDQLQTNDLMKETHEFSSTVRSLKRILGSSKTKR